MEKNSIDRKNSPSGINSAKSFLVFSLAVCLLFLMTKSLSAGVADSTQWRQLFNGKDITGWKQAGPGSHYVEDGFIKSKGGMGLLYWTGEKFGNCVIPVSYTHLRAHET